MATSQQGPSPEFARAYREMMWQGFGREVETTKKVILARPGDRDGNHAYSPGWLLGSWRGIWLIATYSFSMGLPN